MPLDYNDFAEQIKQKYPEYKDVDNYKLATAMVQKYPEYKTQVDLKKKAASQSTLDQNNTSSERLSKTTTKPTASLSLKGDGTYTFPGQEGVVFEKKDNQWSRKEKDSYEFKPISEVKRVNNLEKRAVSLDKYSFEQAPAPKVEQTKFEAAPKAAPKKPLTQTEKAAQTVFNQDFSALDLNSPEYIKRKAEQDKINNSISNVDLNLVGMNEEDVVPKLKESIKDYPYLEIDESGIGYDEVLVRNKVTGESKKISLDNWTGQRDNEESKILRGFLDAQMNSKGYTEAYQRVNNLRSQISDATPTDRIALTEKLVDAQAKLTEEKNKRAAYVRNDKYLSAAIYDKNAQENIKTDLAVTQLRTEDYKEKVDKYNELSTNVNESYAQGKISREDYYQNYVPKLKAEKDLLVQEQQKLRSDYLQIKTDQQSVDEVAGDTFAIESERGNVLTGAASAVLKGIESSVRFGLEGMSEEAGGAEEGSLQGVFQQLAPGSVSNMYTNSANRSTFEQIVFGLAESGGAAMTGIATGGPAGSLMGLYASSYTNMKDQMNTEMFKDVPEWQKILMSSVYGGTVGILEEIGLSKWFTKTPAGKGLTNWILKKVITELPKDATAEAIDLAVKKSFKTAVANGLIQVTSTGLVEGSTELSQEAADMVYKDVFNKLNEKKFFDKPNTWEGVFSRLGENFKLGFLGGAGMQSITQTTQTAKNAITMNQLNNIENLIENQNIKDIYKMNLKDQILSGEITSTQAKEQLQKLDELEATVNKIPNNVKAENKYQAFQLLNEREDIQKEIAGKDPALVSAQTERINAINEELKTISQNAVQEQTTSKVPIQPGAEVGGEVAKGEPQAGSQVATQESQKVEIGGTIRGYETISGDFNMGDARNLLPEQSNGTVVVEGFDGAKFAVAFSRKGADGKNIFEQGTSTQRPGYISASVKIADNATPEQVQAAQQEAQRNLDLILPTVVDGVINAQAVNDVMAQQAPVSPEGVNISQMGIDVETDQVASYRAEEQAELLKAIPNIKDYKKNGEVDKTSMPKTVLAKYNKIYNKYDKLISPLLETIKQKKNLVSNQKETNLAENETEKPKAGNRLFNEPIKAVAEITNRYFQRVFGSQRPTFEGTTDLNVERAKRIADAYEAMEDNPNDPEVRRAYEAMAKETIDQYQDFLDAGYVVEINNEEPYANSADMIEDLRNNNRIKIFSTEAGFGDDPITPEQRAENPLLATTEFTDINGQPMLVNDLFRAVHDFFGHAELGNSFGPKGEENAWNVHSRMYSPLARRAMTTETRGQNSYVNFSGVNERVEALREEARKLREEGKLDEAAEIVNQIYDEAKFADQKIGLLPIEFSEVDQDTETPVSQTENQLTERNARTMSVKYKRNPIVRAAINVLKALPGVKIYLHEDTDQYSNALANKTGDSKQSIEEEKSAGSYIDGEIHLNMSQANLVTLLHEAFHHAVMVNGIKGKYIIDMAKGLRGIIKDKDRLNELDAFIEQYEEETDQETLETRADEFVAQLGGILAANQEELTTTGLTKFMALINRIFKKLGLGNVFTKASTSQDAVNFINAITRGLNVGEDVSNINDPGEGGEVGTFNIPRAKFQKAKSVAEDPRDFIRELVEDADLREFNGQKFITNMYDYTNAGETDLGNGFKINLLGGKNYVPLMMSLKGKKLGELSNLAAFNTKAQAETFIRNANKSGAELFAPHSGTLSQSWQFQQHTFAELFNLVLDKGILTPNELIDVFNSTIKNSAANQANFEVFAKKYGENIDNFDSFESDPKKIIDLLDIKNNYSPKLRKALNNAIASNKNFKKAIGVNNKDEFYKKIMDPLNQGMVGGEIMNVVKFDPNTFEVVQTKESDTDHHPSFGWTLLAKINGIYQPTNLYKSSDVTESYTKYNKKGEEVSRKADELKFEQKNVSSSAGAIPKVAEVNIKTKRKKQLVYHGGDVVNESDLKNNEPLYVSKDKKQAELYAKDNKGKVVEFDIDETKLADEEVAFDSIKELGLEASEGWNIDELNLFELIDPRFETSMSESDTKKLFNELNSRGYDGIKFMDTNLETLKQDIENYVIIDPKKTIFSKRKKQLTQNWVETPVKSMMNSPIAKNSDNLRSVAVDLAKGKINQGEYVDAVKKYSPIGSIGTLFAPSTMEHMIKALGKKVDKLMAPVVDELGKKIKRVGLRLDIPSYLHNNAWIVTIHDGRVKNGNVVSYRNAARLKNVEFATDPRIAINIAAGFNPKGTFARMVGDMVDIPGETAEEQGLNAQAMVEEIMNDPSWVQVGMNPFRHSFFWNRATGAPVVSADEVIQIGGLVYAKNVKEASPNSDEFTVYGKYDEAKNKVVASEEPLLDKSGNKIKFQKAPKILGQKPTVVIVKDEAKALIDQIKLEVRAQREQKKAQAEVRKSISDSVKALVKKGSITLKQASTVVSTLNRVNLDNPEMVKRFNDYIAKVFDKAEYIDKVEQAIRMKRKIKQNLKGASNPFAIAAKGFSQLEPKWVENIDEYIAIAQAVYDSVRKSTARKGVINWKQEADFQTIAQYVFDEEARQTEVLLGNLRSLYERITGKSSDTIGADVMQAELKDLNIPEDFSADVLDQIEEKLAEFEQMVEDTDPEVVQKAASIDPTIIPTKEAIRILDALDTYFMNGSIAGLDDLMKLYTGKENAIKFKYKAKPLRAFGSELFAQKKFQSIIQFNMILERKFRTKEAALAYKKASGIQDIENGANKAEAQAMKKQKEYMAKFGKIKGFNSAENIFQRGALANLLRTMVASEEMQQEEFDRNIEILRNSVDTLNEGNSKDKRKAVEYKKVLTQLGVFNPNVDIEMVLKNANQENINAVNFVIDMFGEIVDSLSDLALGMYNQILTQDVNYTPYVYKMTELAGKYGSSDYGGVDKDGKPKLNFFGTSTYANQTFDKNKAGVLMPITRPKEIRAGMHIDLDFDNNMFRQYRNALVDLYTAGPIRQLEGFFDSEQNKKILGSNEDQDIIYSALVDYIRTKKGTNFVTDDGLKFLNKITDYMAQFGAARALVGIGQFVNQFSSGMTNTIVNAGEYMRPGDFSKDIFELMANSGRSIANVGGDEILVAMGEVDKSIERADLDNRPDQYVLKFIAKENMRLFNVLVAYPDAVARKLAWMAYYRKSMVERGLLGYTEAIDTTKINDTAADYAQLMVDRNMDSTDAALRGSLFRNRNASVKILRSIFLPFSSFGLNQKNRMWNDLNALASGKDIVTSARSIASIAGELVVYNAIRYYVAKTILGAALSLLGYDDDDQEELYNKLLNNAKLSSFSKLFTDIISPIPLLDNQTLELANKAMKGSSLFAADPEAVQKYVDKLKAKGNLTDEEIEKKKLAFEEKNARSFFIDTEANKGSLSIQYEKAVELMDIVSAWRTGEYVDDNKNERFLSKDSQEKLTAPLMMKFVATVYGTRELDQIANKSFKLVKDAESMSSTQQDNYKEVKKELGRDLTEFEMAIIKKKRTVDTAIGEIEYLNSKGKFNKEQGSEYLKLLDVFPTPSDEMIVDIQNGKEAKDIIKKNTE